MSVQLLSGIHAMQLAVNAHVELLFTHMLPLSAVTSQATARVRSCTLYNIS